MIEVTTENKIKIANCMIDYIATKRDEYDPAGFCNAITRSIRKITGDAPYRANYYIKEYLPELLNYRPTEYGIYWFNPYDYYRRIRILEEIIQILQDDRRS
jgi:hypothetical protein